MRAEMYIDYTAPCPGAGTVEQPFCNLQIAIEHSRDWQTHAVLFWGTLAFVSALALFARYAIGRKNETRAS